MTEAGDTMTEAGVSRSHTGHDDGAALAAALRRRDPGAYTELCTRYGRSLHRYLSGCLGGERELAEDLMVQTLAEAVRCIGSYRPQRAMLAAWLFGIARRLVRLELRRQGRRKSVPASAQVSLEGLPETSSPHDLATSITESVVAKAQLARLREFLSERELEVLVLHYVYEFSVQEIGSARGGRPCRPRHSQCVRPRHHRAAAADLGAPAFHLRSRHHHSGLGARPTPRGVDWRCRLRRIRAGHPGC